MRTLRYMLSIFGLLVLLVEGSECATRPYTPTDEVFPNPERGFFHAHEAHSWGYELLDEHTLQGYRDEGITLIKRYFYLENFVPDYGFNIDPETGAPDPASTYPNYDSENVVHIPISSDYLQNMQTDFDRLRAAGLKAIIRFAYTNKRMNPVFEDAALDQINLHLEELRPILQANSDVIALMEAGFIGNWGEWSYTDHFDPNPYQLGNLGSADFAKRRQVVEKILSVLPSHMIQLRAPYYKYQMYDPVVTLPGTARLPIDSNQAFGDSDVARLGYHNDCFLGTATDAGTFSNVWVSATHDQDYMAEETRYVAMGGGVCEMSGESSRFDCVAAKDEMKKYHWSYINVKSGSHSSSVYDGWAAGNCLGEIQQKLGYRLVLVEGTYDDAVLAGEAFSVQMQIRNDGWAAPFNPRDVRLVLRHVGSGDVHMMALENADVRLWLPGDEKTLSDNTLIADVAPGDYELLLHLADPSSALSDRPEYAIRLGNDDGVWEDATGYNNLKHTLQVQAQPAQNIPPFLTVIADQNVKVSNTLVVDIQAADPDQTTPILTVGSMPSFASFENFEDGTGRFTFLPGLGDVGTHTIEVVATDVADGSLTDTETFDVTVLPAAAMAPPKKLLIYSAWTSQINGAAWNVDAASAEFEKYDYVILAETLEQTGHPDHNSAVAILAHSAMEQTKVFGTINFGVSQGPNYTLAEIQSRVDLWHAMDVDGICFENFGYDYGTDRTRQNDAVEYVKGLGLAVVVDAWHPADAFGSDCDPVHNSGSAEPLLNASDFYLFKGHQVASGAYVSEASWQNKADAIKAYQDVQNFKVLSITTKTVDDIQDYDENAFFYAWYSALLYGHEATGWGEFLFSGGGQSNMQAPYRERPAGNFGALFISDVENPVPNVFTRETDYGTLSVNTNTHTTSWVTTNVAPDLDALADIALETGDVITVDVTAHDPDQAPTLVATVLPAFAFFEDHNDGTGTVTLVPALGDEGVYQVQIVATDAVDDALTDIESFQVVVTPALAIGFTPPKKLLIYSAWTSQINGAAWNVDVASAEFEQYDYVILAETLEQTEHYDHNSAVAILNHSAMQETQVFGTINFGVSPGPNYTLAEIQSRVDLWQTMGVEGICFENFGYDYGTDRTRQNSAVAYVKGLGLAVVVDAWHPADAFGSDYDPVHNSGSTEPLLNTSDFYLFKSHQIEDGAYVSEASWQSKANAIKAYQDDQNFKVFSITTKTVDDVQDYDENAFFYAWYSALLYGHEATGWGEFLFSGGGQSNTQAPHRERPVINPGTIFTSPVENLSSNVFTRQTDLGTLSVNTTTHTASWTPVASKPALGGDEEIEDAVTHVDLLPNYPNPFNPATQIVYQIPETGEVQLVVYNILGQSIRVLVRDFQAAGKYQMMWDGKDAFGRSVSSGVYFYRLATGKSVLTRRMMLVK